MEKDELTGRTQVHEHNKAGRRFVVKKCGLGSFTLLSLSFLFQTGSAFYLPTSQG